MALHTITVDAVFEDGVLRPMSPLALAAHQRVTLIVQLHPSSGEWPKDVAAIYQEINEEDRRLAQAMWEHVQETWPKCEGSN